MTHPPPQSFLPPEWFQDLSRLLDQHRISTLTFSMIDHEIAVMLADASTDAERDLLERHLRGLSLYYWYDWFTVDALGKIIDASETTVQKLWLVMLAREAYRMPTQPPQRLELDPAFILTKALDTSELGGG